MATPIRTPRLNNNDDIVRFTHVHATPGSYVRQGDAVAEVETDKANVVVEADGDGYVLGFAQTIGEMIPVGSVLAWLGNAADEPIPKAAAAPASTADAGPTNAEPTLKALLLLNRFGLTAAEVPVSGDRLTVQDVLAHVGRTPAPAVRAKVEDLATLQDLAPGARVPLNVAERGMLRTVQWHRDVAVPAYVEVEYPTAEWDEYAAAFQRRNRLLMNPVLPLMAYRLVQLAREQPKLNCTVVDGHRHQYRAVNLGFTIESGERLTLLSLRDADSMTEIELVGALGSLMRLGMKEKLTTEQTTGVTLSFSSMSRWQVTRHVPVLPPHTAIIVAHAHGRDGVAALGASYDHRVLTGGEVACVLRLLAQPNEGEERG
jgi:pyruvate/2-oxoglutarate dehydrogenase complex dihydrolipoamide acyltransferase (E2) component